MRTPVREEQDSTSREEEEEDEGRDQIGEEGTLNGSQIDDASVARSDLKSRKSSYAALGDRHTVNEREKS